MKEKKFKTWWPLFYTFFKIGLFTFGGGAAMIPIVQMEVVEKKKWLTLKEMSNILAVSEATPGPIAINTSTYVGYKIGGVMGAICATLGCALPSFIIISIISLFYEAFMSFEVVNNAFKGLRVAVILLLAIAIISLAKAVPRNWVSYVLFGISFISMVLLSAFDVSFSWMSIILILLGIIVGVVWEAIKYRKEKKE
ncbi:MAG: chromate transporter [Coprobacillus sp.]|nr:chromate transporter [Coprobacillus sp.]